VLAVPFLTVIEQTAREYRRVFADFPENFVLEHHSLAGLGEESDQRDAEGAQDRQRRLLAENWDAPIILTTNVQLLESLFSNRPSSCRKLHNLTEAVILFDEAQSLPHHLAVPTLAALSHLSAAYRSSIIFATATQPAFGTLHEEVTKHAAFGWHPTEVVPEHADIFKKLKRVAVVWPVPNEKRTWSDLATELRKTIKRWSWSTSSATRWRCWRQWGYARRFHLSTNLCAQHRSAVLDRVRKALAEGRPCRLISTQCVEAGVDVDFPRIYRALAPLDSIVQAAGRCNREGRMNTRGHLGEVIVLSRKKTRLAPSLPHPRLLPSHRGHTSSVDISGDIDIDDPTVFQTYYRRLYDIKNLSQQKNELTNAIAELDFRRIARFYRLIDTNAIQVLVPWYDRWDEFCSLRAEAESIGISADWMRRAQGLAVSVYRRNGGPPAWAIPVKLKHCGKVGDGVSDEWFILEGGYYDNTLGLNPPDGPQLFIA